MPDLHKTMAKMQRALAAHNPEEQRRLIQALAVLVGLLPFPKTGEKEHDAG